MIPELPYKYNEGKIIEEIKAHVDKTYGAHYMSDDLQAFDAWIALGEESSAATFRNTALKYLWRYGKKGGKNKEDLLKAVHYLILAIYVDFHKK